VTRRSVVAAVTTAASLVALILVARLPPQPQLQPGLKKALTVRPITTPRVSSRDATGEGKTSDVPGSPTQTLSGRVIWKGGVAVPGAQVLVSSQHQVRADALGIFVFPEGAVPEASKIVARPGLNSNIIVEQPIDRNGQNLIELPRGASISGVVLDGVTGQPIENASITLRLPGLERFRHLRITPYISMKSEGLGRFRLDHLSALGPGHPTEYTLTFKKQGYQMRTISARVIASDDKYLKILLRPHFRVTGLVSNDKGEQVAGARLKTVHVFVTKSGSSYRTDTRVVQSESNGAYDIPDAVRRHKNYLLVEAEGYQALLLDLPYEVGSRSINMAVVLKAGIEARGTVRDGTGKPLAGVSVSFSGKLHSAIDPIVHRVETTTDDKGQWSTNSLSQINYRVQFDLEGHVGELVSFVAPVGRAIDVVLKRDN